jgi:UDP-3-O-[3-hydroxymyristoyl] glucosamine N-acyltransferase
VIAGQAGLAGHLVIADDVHIGGQGRVASSVTEAGHYSSGTPIQPLRSWLRSASRFTQLDQMAKRIAELEKATGLDQQEDDKP